MRLSAATPFTFPFLSLCSACGGEDATTTAPTEPQTETQQEQPAREGPEGCYIPPQMMCDCTLVEADCSEDVGVWTAGCMSCAK